MNLVNTKNNLTQQSREQLEQLLVLKREAKIRDCRSQFYIFCRTLAPEFYTDGKPHLRRLCEKLQLLYERKLLRRRNQYSTNIKTSGPNGNGLEVPFRKMKINMPPRFGKTRTLLLFCMWVFGKNPTERIIYASYNDKNAADFSRYVRDGINEKKSLPHQIVYSDIFPWSKLKEGNAAIEKWALEGQYFSYIGAGIEGSVTGKGGSILIVDDPIKDAATAYNELALERIWKWYTGTFKSRRETDVLEIINMTLWCSNDICGKIDADNDEKEDWYTMKYEAKNLETGKMLCPEILDDRAYEDLKRSMDKLIFMANYHQTPIDEEGRLYKVIKTYKKLPDIEFDRIICYVDTADEGDDFLCAIAAAEVEGKAYILDALYTKEGMELTEERTVDLLIGNKVTFCKVESNNGGRGFARALLRIIQERYDAETEEIDKKVRRTNHYNKTNIRRRLNSVLIRDRYEGARKNILIPIRWFHQTENKRARILSNATYIQDNIFMPYDWDVQFPLFYRAITTYQREAKNKYHDAEDALTGLAEMIIKSRPKARLI